MTTPALRIVLLVLFCLTLGFTFSSPGQADDWLQFRGSDSTGIGTVEDLPDTFDGKSGENVAWRIDLPGTGPSCPIVVGDQVVITAAEGTPTKQERLHVIAYDKTSGEERWHRQFWATGHGVIHSFGGVAANTPTSDGESIVAHFSSNDLYCFDLEGNLRWMRGLAHDFPSMRNDVGMSSSPVIVGDLVIVQCENQGESFIAGIELADGTTRWSVPRDHSAIWSSLTVMNGLPGDDPLVLAVGRDGLTAFEPGTGRKVWFYETGCNTIASPTTCGRDIYLPANGIHHLLYTPDAPEGEKVEVLWGESRLRGGNPSPVATEESVYVLNSSSVFIRADAESGRTVWQARLKGGQMYPTPVISGGKAFIATYDGIVQVVDLESGDILGESQIERKALATPAIDESAIYYRTNESLWKIQTP